MAGSDERGSAEGPPLQGGTAVAGQAAQLAGRQVCVVGLGITGKSAALQLAAHGAHVLAVDSRDDEERRSVAAQLAAAGVASSLGPASLGPEAGLPAGTDLVVTSPGLRPDTPLLASAVAAGIEVIGDVELAWRLRPVLADGSRQRWLGVTGTNGKTTTVRMLAAMLAAAGHRSVAAGNVGIPILDVVAESTPYEIVAVELSSFQLYWSATLAPAAAVLLNLAPHHLDWHDDLESYAQAKSRVFGPGTIAICNADDAATVAIATAAPGTARLVAFRLGEPGPGELGVIGGALVDRAFADAETLAPVAAVRPPAPHNVADALAAAALARAAGDPASAVAAGLAAFKPDPHRISLVGQAGGITYIDDSKASNAAAAAASLAAYQSVVWVAGGLYQGTDEALEDLVRAAARRLRGAVLIGASREKFGSALARHAPDVPVVTVTSTDTGVMDLVVGEAARLARPGDTVLLAPAAQSFDMFRDYPARGAAFAAAVGRLIGPAGADGAEDHPAGT
jgi:UDP-N-acetylmuramoylalanine--D-glutamate ligase